MYDEIKKIILSSQKIAIFNHKNPDGDAMGSAYALKLALIQLGKEAEVFLREGDSSLAEYSYVKTGKISDLSVEECDLKIAVDSSDIDRIIDFKKYFHRNTIAIDHHVTHIPYADITLVEPDASATGEVIYKLLIALGVVITHDISHNLYVAISSDTGNFKYSSTTPTTHRIVASLMETGIEVGKISKMIFDTKSMKYFKMMAIAIENIKLFNDGKIAILSFDKSDFEAVGIKESDASAIVVLPSKIEGVEIGVYIRKRDDEIKVSLRSTDSVDVAKIAKSFNGGGHIRAAGFSLYCATLSEAEEIVLDALNKEFI